MDANQPPSLDGFFTPVPSAPEVPAASASSPAPSPLDPAWTAPAVPSFAPVAEPPAALSFAPVAEPPAVPSFAPLPTAEPEPAVASFAAQLEAPASSPYPPIAAPAVSAASYEQGVQVAPPMAAGVLTPPAPPAAPAALVEVPAQATSGLDNEGLTRLGAEDTSVESTFLTDLLIETLDRGCSDLHLTVGTHPTVRLTGQLTPLDDRPRLTPQTLQKVLYAIMSQKQREKFEEELELDFAYSVPGRARFRVNIYRQRDSLGAAFRLIPYEIKALEDLGVPPAVANFAMLPRGFVLVTGPTGSGKSTTLAAVVDLANRHRRDHIMTVEDPIEFLHEHKSCLVNQREVGEDTHSFKNALKHVLRQDPDIILVGEMRDLETIEIALTAAETGHLVMATLHTQDAAQTIDRVIDVFPPHQQQQVRVQLAGALQGIVCQQLLRTADGKGRVVATEVLVATPAIRNLIREGKTHQIYSAMQAGAKHGMATMDQHLAELVRKGKVSYDAALEKCHHVEDFNRLCGRM